MSVEGKIVPVTGAGQSIGQVIALRQTNDDKDITLVDARASQPPLPIVPERKVQDLSRQAH